MKIELGRVRRDGEEVVIYLMPWAYPNKRLAVVAEMPDGEPYGNVSVNVPEIPLKTSEFIVSQSFCEDGFWWEIASLPDVEDTCFKVAYGFVMGAPVLCIKSMDDPDEQRVATDSVLVEEESPEDFDRWLSDILG